MKKRSIGPLNTYLGNKVSNVSLENGVNCWAFSPVQYVHASVNNVERYLKTLHWVLPKKAIDPFKADYHPKIDISIELPQSEVKYSQSIIGIFEADYRARPSWYCNRSINHVLDYGYT